jgi:hypothetical protein
MNRSEQIDQLAAALATAQGEFPTIPRSKTVLVRMKNGGTYQFSYAPLETIMAAIRGPLSKNGLAVMQDTNEDGTVTTIINHQSGQWMTLAPVKIVPTDGGPQALGMAITYASRYSLRLALVLAADEDNEAALQAATTQAASELPGPDVALLALAEANAAQGSAAYGAFWQSITKDERKALAVAHKSLKERAAQVEQRKPISGYSPDAEVLVGSQH